MISVGDKVRIGYLYDHCPQNYEEGVVTWTNVYNYYPNGNVDTVEQKEQVEVTLKNECIIVGLNDVSYDKFVYLGMTHQEIQEQRDMNLIEMVAGNVRDKMVGQYGVETDLCGHCIEASDLIVDKLKEFGIKAEATEGWCWYDDDYSCTDMPGDPHTWVEIPKYNLYVDVTADQFNIYMDQEFPDVIIQKGLPDRMSYEEPKWEEEYEEDYDYDDEEYERD